MNKSSKITHLFPHISRLFPVWLLFLCEHTLLIVLVTLFILAHINGINTIGRPCCSDTLLRVLAQPYDLETKLTLAREYWKNGLEQEAKQEIEIVRDLLGITTNPDINPESIVLGAFTSRLEETIQTFHPKQEETNANESYWEKIVEVRPNYRDGYVILALLSYRKKSFSQAIIYRNKALTLDPNYIFPKELTALR